MRRKETTAQGIDNYGSEVSLEIPPNGLYNSSSDCIVSTDDEKKQRGCCEATGDWFRDLGSNIFRKKILYKRLPILNWLPKYNTNDFIGDLIAGITVGLTVIPQGLAYAGIAGLDIQVSSNKYTFSITNQWYFKVILQM